MSSYFHLDEGGEGERNTRRYCYLYLDPNSYRQYHDVVVSESTRLTQIDHVVVSEYGIFVIETKMMGGWIYGDVDSSKWTQVFRTQKYIFQNPLRQNYLHTLTLAKFLDIDHSKFHSVIVFWGECEFKTDMPQNVRRNAFVEYIKRKKQILLTKEEVNHACRILHGLKENKSSENRLQHLLSLKSDEICPRCRGKLMKKTVKRGSRAGTQFLGCCNFPRCNYSRSLESVK